MPRRINERASGCSFGWHCCCLHGMSSRPRRSLKSTTTALKVVPYLWEGNLIWMRAPQLLASPLISGCLFATLPPMRLSRSTLWSPEKWYGSATSRMCQMDGLESSTVNLGTAQTAQAWRRLPLHASRLPANAPRDGCGRLRNWKWSPASDTSDEPAS